MMDIILGYLLAVNITSFLLYGIDKYKAKKGQPTTSREQYQACLEYCRGAKEEDDSQMAHIRGYSSADGSHWRQHRSMGRYAALASQDDAQEI